MFQVLEHMDGLNELMNKLRSILDDDGVILVSVPNNKRIEFNELMLKSPADIDLENKPL